MCSFREVIYNLHKQALEDREFGIKLALAISDPKVYSINDCNLRLIMLQTLQKDYDGNILLVIIFITFSFLCYLQTGKTLKNGVFSSSVMPFLFWVKCTMI